MLPRRIVACSPVRDRVLFDDYKRGLRLLRNPFASPTLFNRCSLNLVVPQERGYFKGVRSGASFACLEVPLVPFSRFDQYVFVDSIPHLWGYSQKYRAPVTGVASLALTVRETKGDSNSISFTLRH